MFRKLIVNANAVLLVSCLSVSASRSASEETKNSAAHSDVSTKHWFDLDFTWDDFPHSVYPTPKKISPEPQETYKSPFEFHFSWDAPPDKNHADQDLTNWAQSDQELDHKGGSVHSPHSHSQTKVNSSLPHNNMPRGAVKSGPSHDNIRKIPLHYTSKPDLDSAEFLESEMPDKPKDFDDPNFLHSIYPPRAVYDHKETPKSELRRPYLYFPSRFTSKPILSVNYPPVYTPRISNDSAQDTNYYGEWMHRYYKTGH